MSFVSKILIVAATIAVASPALAQTPNGTATPAGPAASAATGPSATDGKMDGQSMSKSNTMATPSAVVKNGSGETKSMETGGRTGVEPSKN